MIKEQQLLETLDNPEQLLIHLIELAKNVNEHYQIEFDNEEEIYKEAALFVLPKSQVYKKNGTHKQKAFNFFATCIGCYFRQVYRSQKHKREGWTRKKINQDHKGTL